MDDRGQAVVLGAVLLFGIVTIAFAGYQAYQVPNQNAQTEFQHFEEAKDQMVQLRSAASDTAAVSQPRSVTFPLGTSFQQRSFAVNPPPPTGELATSETHTITIYDSAGTVTDTVEARLLTYDPNYREYQPGVLRYEHGIVYLDARDVGGGVVFLEEYTAPLRLVPIQNEFGASGQRQIGLELYRPGGTEPIEISSDDTVSIPTKLNESDWEESIGVSVEYNYTSTPHRVNLTGADVSDITPVGINDPPEITNSTIDYSVGEENNRGREDNAILQGTEVDTSNNDLIFQMRHTGTESIIIEKIGIETQLANTVESSTSSNEVDITGSTVDGELRTKNNNVLQADGTIYDFKNADEVNSGQGQYATIAAGDEVTVDIREFDERLDNGGSNPLQFTDSANDTDVTVTFVLSDGSRETLYLEQSS